MLAKSMAYRCIYIYIYVCVYHAQSMMYNISGYHINLDTVYHIFHLASQRMGDSFPATSVGAAAPVAGPSPGPRRSRCGF